MEIFNIFGRVGEMFAGFPSTLVIWVPDPFTEIIQLLGYPGSSSDSFPYFSYFASYDSFHFEFFFALDFFGLWTELFSLGIGGGFVWFKERNVKDIVYPPTLVEFESI